MAHLCFGFEYFLAHDVIATRAREFCFRISGDSVDLGVRRTGRYSCLCPVVGQVF